MIVPYNQNCELYFVILGFVHFKFVEPGLDTYSQACLCFVGVCHWGHGTASLPDLIAHGENVGGRENSSVTHSIFF
jgi:hypothetical protein